jgi:TIR domain-containing protein
MPAPERPFIFVSYSSKDAGFVHPEIKRLERQGYKVWYDQGELQPARFWAEEIRKAIATCTCFMAFITEDSVASEHVCDEIDQALKANKPFIGIYWDNVELPSHLQKVVRTRQTLDRHSMHPSAYEEPLSRALSEYINLTVPESRLNHLEADIAPRLVPTAASPSEALPKVVFFSLLLLVVVFLLLAVVVLVTPNLASAKSPDDLLNNRLTGFIGGLFFIVIALGLGGAAFAVFQIYLRRK